MKHPIRTRLRLSEAEGVISLVLSVDTSTTSYSLIPSSFGSLSSLGAEVFTGARGVRWGIGICHPRGSRLVETSWHLEVPNSLRNSFWISLANHWEQVMLRTVSWVRNNDNGWYVRCVGELWMGIMLSTMTSLASFLITSSVDEGSDGRLSAAWKVSGNITAFINRVYLIFLRVWLNLGI